MGCADIAYTLGCLILEDVGMQPKILKREVKSVRSDE
jgi:hypothetical protein